LSLGVLGCGETGSAVTKSVITTIAKTGDAIAEAVIVIGNLVLKIPHFVGKVVGVFLISGGAILKVIVANLRGESVGVDLELTPDQILQIQKAIHSGQAAKVTQLDGSASVLKIEERW
jgi:hypothetical protein